MRDRSNNNPIGVFDSGVGGLTVFKALKKKMPEESLIYFGDTAHVPYGSKSKEAVTRFSLAIGKFLVGHGIKLLVVACNTASALALPELKKILGIPVVGVIGPGVRAAQVATHQKTVGVIATEATIASSAYQKALEGLAGGIKTVGISCPLFVPLVEEGWWTHPVARAIAQEYLKPLKRARIDTLILGCTHYPLLKSTLQKVMGSRVRLIDSAEEIAREVDELRTGMGLQSTAAKGNDRFFCSDGPDRFLRLARRLLGVRIQDVSVHSFD